MSMWTGLLLCLVVPAQQEVITGPPAATPETRGLGDLVTRPLPQTFANEGDDIRVNSVVFGAQNESSIAVNPLNRLNIVAVANDYRNGPVHTGWYASQDGGQTWASGVLPLEPGHGFSGDPAITFDPAGVAHVVCMQYLGPGGSAVFHYRSLNGGTTWSAGTEIDRHDNDDKPSIAADRTFGPHHGQLAIVWNRFTAPDNVLVSVSDDQGGSWSPPRRLNDGTSTATLSPDVAYGDSSVLYVMWSDRGSPRRIWLDRSTDGGQSFGLDNLVTTYTQVPTPLPNSSFRVFDIFSLAADWTGGTFKRNVYIAYHHWIGGQADVRLATSFDRGTSWSLSEVHPEDTSNADQVFPAVEVDAHGSVNAVWYDRRLDPGNFMLWAWAGRSTDAGTTFDNVPVSDVGFDHQATEFPGFIGDYIGLAAGQHQVHPLWCDGRSGSQDLFTESLGLSFRGDANQLSVANGGFIQLDARIGPNAGFETYWMLGSGTGTQPGMTFPPDVHVPLNWDPLTALTLQLAGRGPFPNSVGALDFFGRASMALNAPGPFGSHLIGAKMEFSVLVLNNRVTSATNAWSIELVP